MIWHGASRTFDGAELHEAILVREWTVAEFAEAAGISPATVHGAIAGQRVRDRTALTILRTLATRVPTPELLSAGAGASQP